MQDSLLTEAPGIKPCLGTSDKFSADLAIAFELVLILRTGCLDVAWQPVVMVVLADDGDDEAGEVKGRPRKQMGLRGSVSLAPVAAAADASSMTQLKLLAGKDFLDPNVAWCLVDVGRF